MTNRSTGPYGTEGFRVFRLAMVLSSLSPLFVLWTIRGSAIIPDTWLVIVCLSLVALPTWFLHWRVKTARAKRDERQVTVGAHEDSQNTCLCISLQRYSRFIVLHLRTTGTLWLWPWLWGSLSSSSGTCGYTTLTFCSP